MALITDLPPELLDRICELIPSQPTLANLVRCSHQFYDVGAPHLYRSIDLSRTKLKDELRHLEVITALFLRKPELGRSVRHLAIRESSTRLVVKNEKPLLPEIQEAIRQQAVQISTFPQLTSTEADTADSGPVEDEDEVELEDDDEDDGDDDDEDDGDVEDEYETEDENEDDDESEDLDPGVDVDLLDLITAQEDAASDAHSNWSTTDGSNSEADTGDAMPTDDTDDAMPTDAGSALELAKSSEYFRDSIVLALLVQCLSKLTTLDLEIMGPARLRYVQALLRLSGPDQLLGHVKTVCLGSSRPEVRLDFWRDLFTLPSLSSVYLHRVLAERGQTFWDSGPSSMSVHPLARLQPRSLDITHIEMRDCRIAPWELRRMLQVPKALRTFIYDMGEGTNDVEPLVNISYKSVREALEQQKDSLEQIWIDYPHDYLFDEWGGAGSSTRPMGSFAEFEKLRRFRIASTYLFGFTADTDVDRLVDSLPEQLESLHLTHGDEDEEITAGLQKLLEAKQQGRFQNLKEINVEVCLPWLVSNGREPLAADHTRANKEVMAELVQKADGMELEMRLFINHSQSRIYSPPRRVQCATRGHWTGPEREESTWGFDGEVAWPPRMSRCMTRPGYPEIKIDEQGTIKFTDGVVAEVPVLRGPTLLGPAFLGPILFD